MFPARRLLARRRSHFLFVVVVGSVICSNDVVMTLSCGRPVINSGTAIFDAGCSIEEAQKYLMVHNKQLVQSRFRLWPVLL